MSPTSLSPTSRRRCRLSRRRPLRLGGRRRIVGNHHVARSATDSRRERRAGGEAPRTTSPSGWTTLRTVASDGVWIRRRTSADPPLR